MAQGTLRHVEQAAGGRLDIPAAVDAVVQAATGIAAIHSAGVLHRDIKPQNIMATSRDGVQIYRVGDLGVAVEHDVEAIELTGTLAYLAPEIIAAGRAREAPPFSHVSDIYGLGATLYRLVTGRTPVQALADAAGLQGKVHAADLFAGRSELPDPRSLRSDCPKPLAEILLRLTAIDPAARPPTAEDAAEAIQAALTAKRRLFPW
jgi:serine/threonine-protein kinase